MLLCSRCACRIRSVLGAPVAAPTLPSSRALSRDTSQEVPISFNSDLEENKTSVNILNEDKSKVFFDRFGRYGFKLSTGIFVLGPVLAFPKSVYSWRVASTSEVGPSSLGALRIIYPRPDIFLLGKGDSSVQGLDTQALTTFFRELKLNWEILPTEEALTTFNFLNSEGRYVAGAFLPPSMRDMYKEELEALEASKRMRGLRVLDNTGGTYGGEVPAPSIFGKLPPPPMPPPSRRRRASPWGGEGEGEAAAARALEERARLDGERERLEEARRRVKGEGEGEDEPKAK